uniref:Acireductone dioxygenase n=1 Tax=Arion vulgaris TaxID=1028688 RepID=A0A0B7B8E4_9EUPU
MTYYHACSQFPPLIYYLTLYPLSANITRDHSRGFCMCFKTSPRHRKKMVRAWYRTGDNKDNDSFIIDSTEFVSLEEVSAKTGMLFLKFNADTWSTNTEYAALKEKRGYNYQDICELSPETVPNYDQLMKTFSTEHIHEDEEIRFVLAGTGYFEVRDWDDRWIRLQASKDDLLIIPAGMYHRFVLDEKEYIKVQRLFSGAPVWAAFYRPEADSLPVRQQYLAYIAELKQKNEKASNYAKVVKVTL